MAFVIDKFGSVYASATELPTLEGRQPQGSSPVASSLIRLPGGASYDWRGSERARIPEQEVIIEGEYVTTDAATLETKLADFKKLAGVRDKLWRSNGTAQQWRTARLLEVASDLEAGLATRARLRFRFALCSGPWSGTARTVTAALDASPKALSCTNGGNAAVDNPILTVTAAGSSITTLTIDIYGAAQLNWAGTLSAGSTLTVDCGVRSVKIGGTDAYAGFSLSVDWHKINAWLRMEPGGTNVHITKTGGSVASQAKITYNDGWV